ncbi:longitudinals lacking protein, isoforms H/M/V-like isoform X7 [Portunus trituberculatus]|uniref:longitudinals lacking protein, isoforms H/M/V-like isoform X7 n=1 Tax=Portunus trituberculatus TaxID=210409 RepID=UPI001E1CF08A|nr:longitudinals lacking protein, isoforms H/M/V-like isoform X7 [Portunus trituberculatus]XP_045103731.1 longitudinals lacking protein, isoforms H/M/V-like isoform X7 [Portunus trituberculatus]
MEELLSLKWNNHRTTFIHILGVLRDKQAYTDVTLACDGKFYSVHKLVLSTCSDYFCAMFDKTACKSPVIVLKDIKSEDLEALLDYMYLGEVNVRQSDLASLIKAAENLRIKGLAVPDDEPPNKSSGGALPSRAEPRRDGGSGSPPAKRKRREEVEDGREDVRPPPTQPGSLHTPPPSRPKSPVSQRLSPSPHRTSQESPATEDRTSRPLSSPVEAAAGPHTASQPPGQSAVGQSVSNQYRSDDTPSFVKVEMEEDHTEDLQGDSYNLGPDGYKEEGDDSGGTMNNDLPEFLQAAASGSLASSSASFPHPSFAGPSGYQPGDLAGWQGDGSSIGFPPHLNFSTSESSSQQNAPGASGELSAGLKVGSHGQLGQGDLHRAFDVAGATPIVGLECPVCGKRFQGRNRRQNLEHHLVTHTGERRYPCPLCPHRAAHKWHLKTHLLRRHAQHPALAQMIGTASQPPGNIQNHVEGQSQQAQV